MSFFQNRRWLIPCGPGGEDLVHDAVPGPAKHDDEEDRVWRRR
jgi:hypothetical protein